VLAGPRLNVLDGEGGTAGRRLTELEPGVLPDLFSGDQLVLLGRYSGGGPLNLRLSGNFRGRQQEFDFTFDLARADIRHPYVPRLWAARRIAVLSEAVRDLGAGDSPGHSETCLRELVDEIVRLSTEFGVLTEYTSFLAREGTDLDRRDALVSEAVGVFQKRALGSRSGAGSASQDMNLRAQKGGAVANMRNSFLDEKLQRVEVSGVQQVADRAYYRRGGRWVDSRLTSQGAMPEPAEVIEMGSAEHRELVVRLTERGINAAASLPGEVLIEMDGRAVLVK
jgi:Ca-activated chloride channel family protein